MGKKHKHDKELADVHVREEEVTDERRSKEKLKKRKRDLSPPLVDDVPNDFAPEPEENGSDRKKSKKHKKHHRKNKERGERKEKKHKDRKEHKKHRSSQKEGGDDPSKFGGFPRQASAFAYRKSRRGERTVYAPVTATLLANNAVADFDVKVKGVLFKLHKCVLAEASDVFAAMFESGMEEAVGGVAVLKDTTAAAFKAFTDAIYHDNRAFVLDLDLTQDVMYLAEKYNVDILKRYCDASVAASVSPQNVLEVLASSGYTAEKTVAACCAVLVAHAEVMQSPAWLDFNEQHPVLSLEISDTVLATCRDANFSLKRECDALSAYLSRRQPNREALNAEQTESARGVVGELQRPSFVFANGFTLGAWTSNVMADFTVNVNGKKFKLHTCVLAEISSVFAAMFESRIDETALGRLSLTDTNPRAFKAFIDVIYRNKWDFLSNVDLAQDVLHLAEKYNVGAVKRYCDASLAEKVSEANVLEILTNSAARCNAEKSKAACIEILAEHTDIMESPIWRDFKKRDGGLALAVNDAIIAKLRVANDKLKLDLVSLETAKRIQESEAEEEERRRRRSYSPDYNLPRNYNYNYCIIL